MSQSTTPPLDPVLLSEGETPKRELATVSAINKTRARRGKSKRHNLKPPKFTIADAFNFFRTPYDSDRGEIEFQNERCVRSVAYLLHYASDFGNKDVGAAVVDGLGRVLEKCAADIALGIARQAWLREHGGKP
jgi:hypothetical protein